MIARTLISNIPVRRGAHLEITLRGRSEGLGLNDVLSGISMTHLSNLPSSTLMTYQSYTRRIQLDGPNGTFSHIHDASSLPPFAELIVLPLTDVKELRLAHSDPSIVFHPSSFPALEALAIESRADMSHLFSALFPNPSLFPSLKSLGFSKCCKRRFYGGVGAVCFRPQEHYFGLVASCCNRPSGSNFFEFLDHCANSRTREARADC